MDKVKFIKDVFGEMNEKYLPYVDEVIAALSKREQIVVRLKYNGIPFTKICKLIKRKPTNKEYWDGIRKGVPVAPSTVSNIFKYTIKEIRYNQKFKRIWNGELMGRRKVGDWNYNMGENSYNYRKLE